MSTTSGPTFPTTPAGAQARWLVQAFNHLPIADAALQAHVSPVLLSTTTSAELNRGLAGVAHVRLVSVTSSTARSIAFVISVRGAQRFRAALTVDTDGLIASVAPMQALAATGSPQSMIPRLASGWVAQAVRFQAGGATIYGTYTHPRTAAAGSIPGAVLVAGAGASDRNDNCTERCWTLARPAGSSDRQLGRNALAAVANWLSADGVASLRYDKLGSGQTGWGNHAAHQDRVGIKVYEQEAAGALS